MNKLKLNLKRAAIGAGTVGVIVAGAAAFSAFESHIINVTARIENALFVQEDAIDFGTVFPQEYLESTVRVALSDSFIEEGRVDDISYVIKQKPKVKEPCRLVDAGVNTLGGLINVAQAVELCDPHENPTPGDPYATIVVGQFEGPAWQYCEENLPVNAPYGLTLDDLDDEYWHYCYLPLANYLSKHEVTEDDNGEGDLDVSVDAFHSAYQWIGGVLPSSLDPQFIASGYLAKSDQDTEDSWTIDLKVPCFVNHCAQEADNPDNIVDDDGIPGFYVPTEFRLPTSTEHAVFGTDLWIEVTGVSLAEQATTLTVIKEVIKDDGGNAVVGDFALFIEGNPVIS